MKITLLTVSLVFSAWLVSTLGYFPLAIFYFVLAAVVVSMGINSNSWSYAFLGFILFSRYCLENYEYDWSPIHVLATGHFLLAAITYVLVRASPNRFLLYFPALMCAQGISDIMFTYGLLPFYLHIHNVLAIMQMSAFLVLAWETKRHAGQYDPVKDLIENLLMTMARGWQLWKRKLAS